MIRRFSRLLAALAVAAPLFLGAAEPAGAQLFSDDAAREKANRNEASIADLKRAMALVNQNAEKALAEAEKIRSQLGATQAKLQRLESQNRALQGALAEARHAADSANSAAGAAAETARQLLEEFRAQSAKLEATERELRRFQELAATLQARGAERDSRLAEQAELSAALLREIGELGEFAQVPEERSLYESASALFQRRDYEGALKNFRQVLRFYPDGRFADGARYWESASLHFLGRHDEAAAAARALTEANPNSDKRLDAELILARALRAMGSAQESRAILRGIIESDPASLAADKARQLLADIGEEGADSDSDAAGAAGE